MLNVDTPAQLEQFRDYLHLLARMHIDPRLRRDCDPSDIVQTVLLRAHQGQAGFRGTTPEEIGAWLRQILANTLADTLRDRLRGKRDVRRAVHLEQSLHDSSQRLAACASSRDPSPSAVVAGKENALRLASALARLPEPQREAVTLKHFEGRPLIEGGILGEQLTESGQPAPQQGGNRCRRAVHQVRDLQPVGVAAGPDERHGWRRGWSATWP